MVMDGEDVDVRMSAMQKRRQMFLLLEVVDGIVHDQAPQELVNNARINNYSLGSESIKILQQSLMNYKHHKGRGSEVIAGLLKIHNALEAVRTHP